MKPPPTQQSFSSPKIERGHYEDTLREIHRNRQYDQIFLVNSVPKSGSTFTMGVLKNSLNGTLEYGGDLELEVEQTFSLSGVQRTSQQSGNIIYKFHALPNYLNLRPIRIMDMKFINIVRDLLDTMISIDEHLLRGVNDNNVTLWPGLIIKHFNSWDDEKRYDFICDFIMPWYFKYINGWASFDQGSIVWYEEMVRDPDSYFAKVERQMGLGAGTLRHSNMKKKPNLRFNVGKVGRGEILRHAYMPRLHKFASYYPDTDFSDYGLD